jgi:peptidoglycan hydrolase-like protein with peptidoglycan-binding domain
VEPSLTGSPVVGTAVTVNTGSWTGASVYQNFGTTYNGFFVRNIQLALNLAGITTSVDGNYGPQTRSNVTTFQASNGLVADGIAGPMTYSVMERLLSNAAQMTYAWFSCATPVAASTSAPPAPCTIISGATASSYTPVAGDVGKHLSVKVTGARNGVTTTTHTATIGAVSVGSAPAPAPTPSATLSATTSPTPTPTPTTSSTPSVTPSPTASSTPSVTPSPTASPTPTPTAPAVTGQPAITGVAKVGQTLTAGTGNWTAVSPYQNYGPTYNGYFVRNIQVALNGAGLSVKVDGVYGSATRTAVRTFQSQKGLRVDGVAGPQTWAAMQTVMTSLTKFTYKWYSCTAPIGASVSTLPSTCSAVTSGAAATYRPVAGNVGRFMTVAVTGTSSGTVKTVFVPTTSAVVP